MEETIAKVVLENEKGYKCSMEFMGENTITEKEANAATEEFIEMARQIESQNLYSTISLDLSHIGLAISKDLALANVAVEYFYTNNSAETLNDLLSKVTLKDELSSLFPEGFLSNIEFFSKHGLIEAIAEIINIFQLDTIDDYLAYMDSEVEEADKLMRYLLINVTSFFRDPEFYQTLEREIFPSIVSQGKATDPIRIWVAGCSTGEEPYSIAMTLAAISAHSSQPAGASVMGGS